MKHNPNSMDPKDYPDVSFAKKGSDADINSRKATRGFKKDGSPKGRKAWWAVPAAAAIPGTRHVLKDPHHAAALEKCPYICAVIVDGEML